MYSMNNYRGLAVSSCLGKLFNKILQKRLDKYCKKNNLISVEQGSGKAGSRTSDHLLIVRCLFDKYVKYQGKKLFTCFVDIRKAFDSVPRSKLFYTLVKEYNIGGNFLAILQQIYNGNKIYIKLADGLVEPFETTVGVKQGCVFSPILFNLYINKICSIFDQSCDPVQLNNMNLNCLLWADDLFLVSKTARGLQNSINKMHQFYSSVGLEVNIKKTKVMVFNKSGRKLENIFEFKLDGKCLEITDEYQYLGLKLRPSGSFSLAVQELNDKASRAWFGISNIVFKNKRMQIDRIFTLFDSLVTPVATYCSPLWLPFNIPTKNLETKVGLHNYWEKFKCETLNQKCGRISLSVNSKTTRLAVLGELGRYPLFLQSLAQCLNYKLSLSSRISNTLIGNVLQEMSALSMKCSDNWLYRVNKIIDVLKIPRNLFFNKLSGKRILKILKSQFDRHFLDKINEEKMSNLDSCDHNKLRTYRTYKSSFNREPYLDLVRNRNQRCFLSRLRVGSHRLQIELGRHTRPVTPAHERFCQYCRPGPPPTCPSCPGTPCACSSPQHVTGLAIDTEYHFLVECAMFSAERNCLFSKIGKLSPYFLTLSLTERFKMLLCPTSALTTKLIQRFIKNMFNQRDKYDQEKQLIRA